MKSHSIVRLIKSEDLNHHGTLFAGRMAEWFVESTFIVAAAYYGNPQNIVCVKVHGFKFTTPVNKGDIIEMESKVLAVGTTSIHTYAKVRNINGGKILSMDSPPLCVWTRMVRRCLITCPSPSWRQRRKKS